MLVTTIHNVTYFSAESIMKFLNKLDKDYDFPIPSSQSHILREFDVLLSNLKLKFNGDNINLFNITINVSNLSNIVMCLFKNKTVYKKILKYFCRQ